MSPQGVMPHPWWLFWQLGDFVVMATLVWLFVRFVRRSDGSSRADAERPAGPGTPSRTQGDAEPPVGAGESLSDGGRGPR